MGYIYLLSFLILFIGVYLFKQHDKPISAILWFVIDLWLIFILNSLIVFIFSLINVPATLFTRSSIFILFSIPFYYQIIKNKQIQKFSFKIQEVFFLIIALSITAVISLYRFGNNFDLYFETTDPANHYLMADRFASSNKLLEKSPGDIVYGKAEGATLFFSYTTVGTMFQLSEVIGNNSFIVKVNIFLIFELSIILFTIIIFLYIINNHIKKWTITNYIMTLLVVILFTFGYVYNNLIFGFHYLGIVILLIELILYLFETLLSSAISKYHLGVLGLFCFSIFTAYYMFVPIVYGAAGLYILYNWKIAKMYSFKTSLKYILIILVIPFIIGMWYYFMYNHNASSSVVGNTVSIFKLEGYIYRNLFSNFLFLAILIPYRFICNVKNKKITIYDMSILLNIIFIAILFVPFYNNKIASYYYYKLYYPLWMLCFIDLGLIVTSNDKEIKGISISILIAMFLLFTAEMIDADNRLYRRNNLLNNNTFVDNITNIYWFNKVRTDKSLVTPIFNRQELKDIEKIYNKYKKELNINEYVFYDGLLEKLWLYSLTKTIPIPNYVNTLSFYEGSPSLEEACSDEKIKYILYKTSEEENYISEEFSVVYRTYSYILASRN